MNKVLIITGPTGVGKTKLGILLAEKYNGEIISADSRQVYKYMDIGTGKDRSYFQWGIDLVEPNEQFNVSDYVIYAKKIIEDIWKRGKLPIVVGGTGQYIKELLWPSETLHIPQDLELRSKNYELVELQKKLQEVDTNKWERMNNSDRNNPRRLIRAIEVAQTDCHGLSTDFTDTDKLIIGLVVDDLDRRIDERVEERFRMGILEERKKLEGFQLPKTIGYQNETLEEWKMAEKKYAKKQVNYLKKHVPGIIWTRDEAKEIIDRWYYSEDGKKSC